MPRPEVWRTKAGPGLPLYIFNGGHDPRVIRAFQGDNGKVSKTGRRQHGFDLPPRIGLPALGALQHIQTEKRRKSGPSMVSVSRKS